MDELTRFSKPFDPKPVYCYESNAPDLTEGCMTAQYTITQSAPTLETSSSDARSLFESAQSSLGFVPEMYRHMAKAPGVLSTYMHGYDQFRANSSLKPVEQEVIFLTISRENGCGYCMAAHSMLADKVSDVPGEILAALREGRKIADKRLEVLSHFTRVMFQTRGTPDRIEAQAFLDAGFTETHIMQIVLALAVKTLSNYSNHVNQPDVDEVFSGYKWDPDC